MWKVQTVRCHGMPGTFRWYCSQSCMYSDETAWRPCWKISLETPGNTISKTPNFKMSLDASTLKNLYLWCEFQSCLLFIISLLIKNFLTALIITVEFLSWVTDIHPRENIPSGREWGEMAVFADYSLYRGEFNPKWGLRIWYLCQNAGEHHKQKDFAILSTFSIPVVYAPY